MSWKTERQRGTREAREQFAVLSERWPQAFPQKSHLVRPLSSEVIPEICKELGWTNPYTRTVIGRWKQTRNYCSAVLCYNERIRLDGSLTEHLVSEDARAAAKAQLARLAAARAARAARLAEKQRRQEPPPAAEPPAAIGMEAHRAETRPRGSVHDSPARRDRPEGDATTTADPPQPASVLALSERDSLRVMAVLESLPAPPPRLLAAAKLRLQRG